MSILLKILIKQLIIKIIDIMDTRKFLLIAVFTTFLAVGCNNQTNKRIAKKMDYSLLAQDYKTRLEASDPTSWKPVACPVTVPVTGGELGDEGLFKTALERNISYLLSTFSVNHMLVPFRLRAGQQNPPDDRPQVAFWDRDLRGSNAGRFMMGAGNTLRWMENTELRRRLNELIDGIEACGDKDGYILAYPHIIDSMRSEEANYARAWFTHGLIEAAIAGNPKAYGLLRQHADWFNKWDELHPKLMYWSHNSHQGHIASTRTYLSPVGKPEDLQLAEKFYVCDWWIDELAARHDSAVWQYPLQNPHSYLITSFEAYLDHYIATGDKTYLDAMLGAWELIHNNWEHVGGSIAICEAQWFVENGKRVLKHYSGNEENSHPPHSYYLGDHGHTCENCGSSFWIKFNQRLHRLFPQEEKYVAEIEKSIYNITLACQQDDGMIRYHAPMRGQKEHPNNGWNTCCEGQCTRLLGSLPEYIYSIANDGIYINLYEASSINCKIGSQTASLKLETAFPSSPAVSVKVLEAAKMKIRIRVPSWASDEMPISINGKVEAKGKAGTYVELSRKWAKDDRIEFTLPMSIRFTPYNGIEHIVPKERTAVEYGPLLLACVRKGNVPHLTGAPDLQKNLVADPSKPLRFTLTSDTSCYFMPYNEISTEEFEIYEPTVATKAIDLSAYMVSPNGFSVEFFNNPKWEGKPVYSGTVRDLHFEAGGKEGDKPMAKGVNLTDFSSRFVGEFQAPETGEIFFSLVSDDGYRFYVDDKLLEQSERRTTGAALISVNVEKGRRYKLKVEHKQNKGDALIDLRANIRTK